MTIPKRIVLQVVSLTFAIAMTVIAGCDSNTPTTNDPPKPTPPANPGPDNKLKDITTDNEAANMDRIKKAGEGK